MRPVRMPVPFAGLNLSIAGLPVTVNTLCARLDPRVRLR